MVLRKLALSLVVLATIYFSFCTASGIIVSLKHEGCGPEKKLFHKSQDVSLVVEGLGIKESDVFYLKPASKAADPCGEEGEHIAVKQISPNTFRSTKPIKADFTQTLFVCRKAADGKGQVVRRLPAYLFHSAVIPLTTFFLCVVGSLLLILPRPKTVLVLVVSGVLTFIFEELDEQLELPQVAIALFVALMLVYAARMALIPFLIGGTVILTVTWRLALRYSCNNTFIRVMNALSAELKDTSNPVVQYIIMPLSPVVFAWLLLKALKDVKPSTSFASLRRSTEEDEDVRRSTRPRSAPQRFSYKLEPIAQSPQVNRTPKASTPMTAQPMKASATPKKAEIVHQATNPAPKASPAAKSTPSAATKKPAPSPVKSPAKKSSVATPSKATKRSAEPEPEPKLSTSIESPKSTPKKRKLLPN